MRADRSELLRKTVISAMFLALATAFKMLSSFYLPLFGANGIKVSFSGIFTVFPAVLFGPVYGAVVGGLTDFLGWALKPDGAYIPLLTLTAALGGFIQGYLWRAVRKKTDAALRILTICFFVICGIYGVATHIALNVDGLMNGFYASVDSSFTKVDVDALVASGKLSSPSSLVAAMTQYAKPDDYASNFVLYENMLTIGLEVIALVGIAVISVDAILRKRTVSMGKSIDKSVQPFRFIFVMLFAGIIVSTLNTPILQIYIPALVDRAFVLLWIPRMIKEVIVCGVQAYIASALYTIYQKTMQFETSKKYYGSNRDG